MFLDGFPLGIGLVLVWSRYCFLTERRFGRSTAPNEAAVHRGRVDERGGRCAPLPFSASHFTLSCRVARCMHVHVVYLHSHMFGTLLLPRTLTRPVAIGVRLLDLSQHLRPLASGNDANSALTQVRCRRSAFLHCLAMVRQGKWSLPCISAFAKSFRSMIQRVVSASCFSLTTPVVEREKPSHNCLPLRSSCS
eukprot:4583514-Pleurochrysis_carterae.AAC.2